MLVLSFARQHRQGPPIVGHRHLVLCAQTPDRQVGQRRWRSRCPADVGEQLFPGSPVALGDAQHVLSAQHDIHRGHIPRAVQILVEQARSRSVHAADGRPAAATSRAPVSNRSATSSAALSKATPSCEASRDGITELRLPSDLPSGEHRASTWPASTGNTKPANPRTRARNHAASLFLSTRPVVPDERGRRLRKEVAELAADVAAGRLLARPCIDREDWARRVDLLYGHSDARLFSAARRRQDEEE